MEWKNKLTELLHVRYPIVQAPMLGASTPEMVAIVSNLGGLGSLPVGGLSPEKTRAFIRQTKTLTEKPFVVNLFAHDIPAVEALNTAKMEDFLNKLSVKYGLKREGPSIDNSRLYSYREQIEILLEENIPIVSFTFGILDEPSIQALKEKGTLLIGTATCVQEALLLDEKGIDIVTAQGIEAGGHRGTFLEAVPLPMIFRLFFL